MCGHHHDREKSLASFHNYAHVPYCTSVHIAGHISREGGHTIDPMGGGGIVSANHAAF